MVLCVDCYEANKGKYEIEEELEKKRAKKCSGCGKLKRAIYVIKEEEPAKKTKAASTKKTSAKKTPTRKTTKKAKISEFDKLVKSFEEVNSPLGIEIAKWLKRELEAIKYDGRDYWTPQGIFWFAFDGEKLLTTFNGMDYDPKNLDSMLG